MKIISTIIFSLLFSKTYSQVSTQWRFDNSPSNPIVIVTDIIHDGANTFVSIQDFDSNQSAIIEKLDSAGNLLYSDTVRNSYSTCEKKMVRDKHGFIYVCGQRDTIGIQSKIKIEKLDSQLNPQWIATANDSNPNAYYSSAICYSPDEDKIYIVCQKSHANGTSMAIFKFDTDGNFLWESDSLPSLGLNCIRFTSDLHGNIILGGFVDFPGTDEDFTLLKVDTSGSIVWNISTHAQLDDRVEDLVIDNYDNIYVFGYFADAISSRVAKYDSAGNFIWMTSISGFYGTKLTTNSSDIYVAGNDSITDELEVFRLDTAGAITGSGNTGVSASGIIGLSLNQQSQLYACYSTDSSTDFRWAISKFDSTASLIWNYIYPDTTPVFAYPTSFHVLDDGFIVSGKIDPFVSTVRFSELIPTNINENRSSDLSYWPNPAKKVLYFGNESGIGEKMQFRLFDVNSHCLYEEKSESTAEKFSIKLPELAQGIYFFQLRVGDKTYSKKLIIM